MRWEEARRLLAGVTVRRELVVTGHSSALWTGWLIERCPIGTRALLHHVGSDGRRVEAHVPTIGSAVWLPLADLEPAP